MADKSKLRDPHLRVLLLNHLASLQEGTDHYIALEARYGFAERRADLLLVSAATCHAFEIKSDFDRLDRLTAQAEQYRRTFDYFTVVTTPRHSEKIKKILGKNEGIIEIRNENLFILRPAKRNKKLLKANLAAICSKGTLARLLKVPESTHSFNDLQTLAIKRFSLPELKSAMQMELERRFRDRYTEFLREACVPFREYDLTLLKQNERLSPHLLV